MKTDLQRILVMGLPGSGKTTLAKQIAARIHAVHYNADYVRATINARLGFSEADRVAQAVTMRRLCDMANDSGHHAVCDFVCPTPATRIAFGPSTFTIWMDTIQESRFIDTNSLFRPPPSPEVTITHFDQIPAILDENFPHL